MTKTLTPTIGFEVHVELKTKSKMFCGCENNPFNATAPNTLTCPVCLGLPDALPVPNKKAIDWTIMIGLALNCQITRQSKFDRKHYFYPDLPKGYQISQYDLPLCTNGYVDTSEGRIGIERVHLEEDTGKLQHTSIDGKPVTLIDFNRGGVPLVEIVTKPDLHSAKQGIEYAKKLRQIITALGVSDCDMEKGSMRLEANISLGLDLGYKVEVKNVNSFRFIGKAIEYELARQTKLLEDGSTPQQETRGWNEKTNTTKTQRVKETAADYRYFPEPDIPPIEIDDAWLKKIQAQIPELPAAREARWQKEFGLRPDYAQLFAAEKTHPLIENLLKEAKKSDSDCNKVIGLIANKQASLDMPIQAIIKKVTQKLSDKITDPETIIQWANQAIEELPQAAEDYKNGKDAAIAPLIGKIMAYSQGKVDGQIAKNTISDIIRGK